MDKKELFKAISASTKQEKRKIEKILRRNHKWSKREMKSANLKEQLAKKLPSYLMPGNIGGYNKVTWPFWMPVNFDLGTDPTYGPNTYEEREFRVTADAAFLMSAIYRKSFTYDTAGELCPLQLRIIDLQSTRQFSDNPIPIQVIGGRSHPSIFPTPYLIMPSARFQFQLSSWLEADQVTTGSGKHQFVVFGYRIRMEDYQALLSGVFA